jgi:hypothetical protein
VQAAVPATCNNSVAFQNMSRMLTTTLQSVVELCNIMKHMVLMLLNDQPSVLNQPSLSCQDSQQSVQTKHKAVKPT